MTTKQLTVEQEERAMRAIEDVSGLYENYLDVSRVNDALAALRPLGQTHLPDVPSPAPVAITFYKR